MKNRYIFLLGALVSLCLFGCAGEQGSEKYSYSLDSWMSLLNDTMKVCKVSIPGTHDALTAEGFTEAWYADNYTTQVATLDEQLKDGLRYFDVRLVLEKDSDQVYLQTSHRTATIRLTFNEVLTKTENFLNEHSSEFLIMKIQYDGEEMSDTDREKWVSLVQGTLTDSLNARYFADFRPDVRVKDLRGKILLLSRTNYGEPVCGALTNWPNEGTDDYVKADSVAERTLVLAPTPEAAVAYHGGENKLAAKLFVQDFYNTIGPRIDAKLQAIEAMFRSSQELSESDNVWILNHTSGFGTPKMDALGYAENASKSNAHLLALLQHDHGRKGIGIIAMDYACVDTVDEEIGAVGKVQRAVMSRSLTKAIIERNFK